MYIKLSTYWISSLSTQITHSSITFFFGNAIHCPLSIQFQTYSSLSLTVMCPYSYIFLSSLRLILCHLPYIGPSYVLRNKQTAEPHKRAQFNYTFQNHCHFNKLNWPIIQRQNSQPIMLICYLYISMLQLATVLVTLERLSGNFSSRRWTFHAKSHRFSEYANITTSNHRIFKVLTHHSLPLNLPYYVCGFWLGRPKPSEHLAFVDLELHRS